MKRWTAMALAAALACSSKPPPPPDPLALPSLAAAWDDRDLGQAATALDATCSQAPARLPRVGDAAFSHVIAPDNRAALPSGPPRDRLAALTRYTGAMLAIYQTYLRCGLLAETMAANAALLEGYAESLALGAEVVAALPVDDPERAQRQAGLDKMAIGLRGGVQSTIAMLTDASIPGVVPPAVGARLGAAIAAVRSAAPAGTVDDAVAMLDRALTAETDPDRKRLLSATASATHP